MARLMSVSLTEAAVVARRKTVTRRRVWWDHPRSNHIQAAMSSPERDRSTQ